jgi:hypothetical protein
MFFCLRNKEPADLERVISMIMQLTSGFTYDVKDVKEAPRHTGLYFSMIIGAFECLYQKIFWESPGQDEKPPPPTSQTGPMEEQRGTRPKESPLVIVQAAR